MVKKAIIAAAGFGTRFLPATKSVPKELLALIDTPVIEYITEECYKAGVTEIIVVTRSGNNSVLDYLDSSKELEDMLEEKGKKEYLNRVKHAYKKANFVFVRQASELPYGTATPLWVTKNMISPGESFAYLFGDDIFLGETNALKEMIDAYDQSITQYPDLQIRGVLGAYKVKKEDASKYGVFGTEKIDKIELFQEVIEKPSADQILSEEPLVRVGRFIYHSSIFDYFDFGLYKTNQRGEFELTDIENQFIKSNNNLLIHNIKSEWLPVGDPSSYLRTTLRLALKDPKYRQIVIDEMKNI